MLSVGSDVAVHLALEPVDMRKSINGLTIAVVEQLAMKPHGQHLFVFRNKAGDKVKVLFWDRNGFVVYYKRLERGRFHWPRDQEEAQTITPDQLQWLLAGLDFVTMGQFPELAYSHMA